MEMSRVLINTNRFINGLKEKNALNPFKRATPKQFLLPMYYFNNYEMASDIDFDAFTLKDIETAFNEATVLESTDNCYRDDDTWDIYKSNSENLFYQYTKFTQVSCHLFLTKHKSFKNDDDFI
ncbi:hypothetical protein [Paenibacillus sp. Leaf72]|uniref:hypothetical protein n=1 Tax=Paenibacillus sp. Leaf72 TaxID=1736234 RepID=UPI0006F2277E|nr:hypothetical protein [Paenibacillus sp. Leaf72]KQN96843.1 hypothetical protein ASF12_22495 [Paenibacillus sp. Leaf72]